MSTLDILLTIYIIFTTIHAVVVLCIVLSDGLEEITDFWTFMWYNLLWPLNAFKGLVKTIVRFFTFK
jgi:hypothetical protein